MTSYKIMTFDGGGVLGVVSMRLLARLNDEVPDLLDGVQLFAGTSIGAFNSVGLSIGLSPNLLTGVFTSGLIKLFFIPYSAAAAAEEAAAHASWQRAGAEREAAMSDAQDALTSAVDSARSAIQAAERGVYGDTDGMFSDMKATAEAAASTIEDAAKAAFHAIKGAVIGTESAGQAAVGAGEQVEAAITSDGSARGQNGVTQPLYINPFAVIRNFFNLGSWFRMKYLPTNVLITAFDLKDDQTGIWRPLFLNNYAGSPSADRSVADALLSTTAAPVYYATFQGHIDGWVFANNPCMPALLAAIDPQRGQQSVADVRMMSFGVGAPPYHVDGQTLAWGSEQWHGGDGSSTIVGSPLNDVFFFNNSELNSIYCKQLLGGERYLRLNAPLPRPIGMDDCSAVAELVQLVDQVDLDPYLEWIHANWS